MEIYGRGGGIPVWEGALVPTNRPKKKWEKG